MPHAVGRYFSGNGERLNTAVINEDRAAEIMPQPLPGRLVVLPSLTVLALVASSGGGAPTGD